jgi:hypothetical protein
MNIFEDKIYTIYNSLNFNFNAFKTNEKLLKAILSIELAHRNIIWRTAEYLVYLIFPYNYCCKNILTIGKFQIKVSFLGKNRKLKNIANSSDPSYIDKYLFNRFTDFDWNNLSLNNIAQIVKLYNGDKSGYYEQILYTVITNS